MAQEQNFIVPLADYLKVGLHIGTKFKTKYMANFIYKTRPDGLVVLNIQEIDKRVRIASNLISQYKPEDIIVVCRRENGWSAVKLFSKYTGIRVFAGRYPPGILTNPNLKTFIQAKLMVIVDPWVDKNALKDAVKVGIPVIALCDTYNEILGIFISFCFYIRNCVYSRCNCRACDYWWLSELCTFSFMSLNIIFYPWQTITDDLW